MFPQGFEAMLLKLPSQFQSVTAFLHFQPLLGQHVTEGLHGLQSFLIGQGAGPGPLNTQGGFTPSFVHLSLGV